jgi:hypothetical protein
MSIKIMQFALGQMPFQQSFAQNFCILTSKVDCSASAFFALTFIYIPQLRKLI